MDEISTDISIKFIFLDVVGPVAQQTWADKSEKINTVR